MSEFYGTQKIKGKLYVNNIGGFVGGIVESGTGDLADAVRELLFTITTDNYGNFVSSNCLDLANIDPRYGGVKIVDCGSVVTRVFPPVIGSNNVGKEFIISNLSAKTLYVKSTSNTQNIVATSQDNIGQINPLIILPPLKSLRIKAVDFPSILQYYGQYSWVVLSKTPINYQLHS